VEVVFAVPDDALPGTHVLQFSGWCGSVTSQADVLVGAPQAPVPSDGGVPVWLWWLLGVLLAAGAGHIIRRIVLARQARRAQIASGL
jgi:hypothetical protein